jgi:predicted nucleotidyltransferase
MEQLDLLRYVARIIEEIGLRYFVTGSTATNFYGEPRFASDIDVVVELPEQWIVEFCRRFPQDEFCLSETAACEAVFNKAQFSIIHPASGLRLDVIVPRQSPFNELRFRRVRRLHTAKDCDVCFASPEDIIIKKMDYYRQDGLEKHLRDIAGVLKTSRDQIDTIYIAQWAHHFDFGDLWTAIQERTNLNV